MLTVPLSRHVGCTAAGTAGDNRIIIHGGANTAAWELGEGARAALRGAGAVLLQREVPEAVNTEVAQVGACVRYGLLVKAAAPGTWPMPSGF